MNSKVNTNTPQQTSDSPQEVMLANVSRRRFMQGAAAASAFVLAARFAPASAEEKKPVYGAAAMPHGWVDDPDVFISIASDGTVTLINHRGEMGQGIRTSIIMVMADEMGADWQQVRVEQAIAHEEKYGNQNTDGSRSMRHWFEPMRRAGAGARYMLEQAAAKHWNVPASECKTDVHKVVHKPSGRSLSFGELAAAAADAQVVGPAAAEGTGLGPLVSQAQWERVQGYIQAGIDEGATLVTGGTGKPDDLPEGYEDGYYVRPTVFANVSNSMTIAREEIFGPVLSIIGYADEDDAVAIANDTDYGLSGGVWGTDTDRALAVAKRLRTGQVDMNGAFLNHEAPFGGYKKSGNGRELGRYGLAEFVESKSINLPMG